MNLWSEFVIWLTVTPRLKRLQRQFPEAEFYPFGSRYVCTPPALTTDVDFMVYSQEDITAKLVGYGYKKSEAFENCYSDVGGGNEFSSWRKGVVNLVLVSTRSFLDKNITATHICKTKNLRRKYHRIVVYEALRGNKTESLPDDFCPQLQSFLESLNGPHGHAIYMAYRIQNGLVP